MREIYFRFRRLIINKFPFIRYIKKYKIIIPKIKALIIWRLLKPKKINYLGKNFYTSIKTFSDPSRNLYAYRDYYETDERRIIEESVSESENCIDIGANIGFYTWWFSRCTNYKGNIYSFECLTDVFQILKKNFINEKNIKLYNGFVGINKNGEYLTPDELINEKISFIKIDIDGPDFYALKSCENIIDRYSPKILVELCENSKRNWDIDYKEVLNFLKNKKYKCYDVKEMSKEFDRNLKKEEIVNIFAVQ